eukprot:1615569-Ditylum_brightwellii.AAC.1
MSVYLDNEGTIDRIAKQQTCLFDYSFHTIDPDWYIIAQICNTLELMNIKVDFKHIKGHQDDDTHYEELDISAQLNIDVDFLVVDYRTMKGMKLTKVTQLPINKAQLHTSNSMITSKYYKTL